MKTVLCALVQSVQMCILNINKALTDFIQKKISLSLTLQLDKSPLITCTPKLTFIWQCYWSNFTKKSIIFVGWTIIYPLSYRNHKRNFSYIEGCVLSEPLELCWIIKWCTMQVNKALQYKWSMCYQSTSVEMFKLPLGTANISTELHECLLNKQSCLFFLRNYGNCEAFQKKTIQL